MLTDTDQPILLFQGVQGAPITLPPLFCPFLATLNDQVEQAQAHALA
ncbi:MAG: hypothetical protein U0350_28790 [Caldilineaceae bacterium]